MEAAGVWVYARRTRVQGAVCAASPYVGAGRSGGPAHVDKRLLCVIAWYLRSVFAVLSKRMNAEKATWGQV